MNVTPIEPVGDDCPAWEDGEHLFVMSQNISPAFKMCACGAFSRLVEAGRSYVDRPHRKAL